MIGVCVGNYPNEYTLSVNIDQSVTLATYLYISFMVVTAFVFYLIQWCCYRPYAITDGGIGISEPKQSSRGTSKATSKGKSGYISLHDEDERKTSNVAMASQSSNISLRNTGSTAAIPSATYAPAVPRLGADGKPLFGGMRSGNDSEYFSKF